MTDGVAPAAARAAVRPGGRRTARARRGGPGTGTAGDGRQVAQAASLYLALTGLAVLVGLFGIVNAMALSIVDRVRELGLLRAVGMDRRQVGSMVRAEAVIIGWSARCSGSASAPCSAGRAARVFEHSSAPTRFTVPVAVLALVAAVAAGAVWSRRRCPPGRRAASTCCVRSRPSSRGGMPYARRCA